MQITTQDNTYEIRNPIWNDIEHTTFNVELNHSEYGWIKFTVTSQDNSELSQKLWEIQSDLEIQEAQEKSLDELKAEKIKRISEHAELFEQSECKEMYIISSLGFRANADRRSLQNLDNLILLNEPVRFRDYDNVFHPPFPEEPNFSIEDLKILRLEMAKNGHNLYEQKFLKQISIMNAETVEQVEDVIEDFVMTDFSGL
jgi:hypothetical protein